MIALFQARLVTMTPSSVVYSCLEYGDEDLKRVATEQGMRRSGSNARTTFKNTDFYRLVIGEPSTELTSSIKGRNAASTLAAHAAVQELSAKRHKAINQAICQLAEEVVPDFAASQGHFEVDLGEQDTFTDAVVPLAGEDLYLEFHHLSGAHCRAASMAAYIMAKLRTYAWHHNVIPR
jgi:alpha-D-ribose 1-methylphosphonate 5-triphosphate synthase subunit PhnG